MKYWKKIKERIYRISPTYRLLRKFVFSVDNNLESLKKEIFAIKNQNKNSGSFFGGHYNIWRQKRIDVFIKHYGINWFKDKKI